MIRKYMFPKFSQYDIVGVGKHLVQTEYFPTLETVRKNST